MKYPEHYVKAILDTKYKSRSGLGRLLISPKLFILYYLSMRSHPMYLRFSRLKSARVALRFVRSFILESRLKR